MHAIAADKYVRFLYYFGCCYTQQQSKRIHIAAVCEQAQAYLLLLISSSATAKGDGLTACMWACKRSMYTTMYTTTPTIRLSLSDCNCVAMPCSKKKSQPHMM